MALDIAVRYALQRTQFKAPGEDREVPIMDYLVHQRRLLPYIAQSHALQFAQNQLVATLHDQETAAVRDMEAQRSLEAHAAGLKVVSTWHASAAIQEAREACGGAGYLAENRLVELRADTDVFTTFEGDNHVLLQLVAKHLLTSYNDDIKSMSPFEWVRFATNYAGGRVSRRTAAGQIMQRILDNREDNDVEGSLFNRGTQAKMFEDREEYPLSSPGPAAAAKGEDDVAVRRLQPVQDHVMHLARAHTDRVVLEAFIAGVESQRGPGGSAHPGNGVRPVRAERNRGGQSFPGTPAALDRAGAGGEQRDQRALPQSAPLRGNPGGCVRHPRAAALRGDAASRAHPGSRLVNLVEEIIDWLYTEQLRVDEQWSHLLPTGFSWWADQYAQTVEMVREKGPAGETGYLLCVNRVVAGPGPDRCGAGRDQRAAHALRLIVRAGLRRRGPQAGSVVADPADRTTTAAGYVSWSRPLPSPNSPRPGSWPRY